MFSATAAEMVDTDQPNSARSGSMSTPGTARNAAAPTSARNVTPATHQAGWIRRVGTARLVTRAEHAGRRRRRDSGPTANMCKDPAMPIAERVHEVVVLALPNPTAFELGLAPKFLGGAVDADERPLYRVRTATLDGGPVPTSGGSAVLPEHDAAILDEADTVVVPGLHLPTTVSRSEEHTSELQSRPHLVCRLLLEKKKNRARAAAEADMGGGVHTCVFG